MEKKFFEEPSVQKVEFEFKERIAASKCDYGPQWVGTLSTCME